jgi:AmmeMemoRadiSam system protein A
MKQISFIVFSNLTSIVPFGGLLSPGRTQGDPEDLTQGERAFLLDLARQTLFWHLRDGSKPEVDESAIPKGIKKILACFVTIEKRNYGLRGCIGLFDPVSPLYENVISRAIAAATKDPRFPPVTLTELKDIQIEISVLTRPKPLPFSSPEDLLKKLQPNKDGVILKTSYGSSTFLPQVWEQLPKKERFLAHLCQKHGAPANTWKKDWKNTEVEIYNAYVFSEESWGRIIVGKNGAIVGSKGAKIIGQIGPRGSSRIQESKRAEKGTELAVGTILAADSDIQQK